MTKQEALELMDLAIKQDRERFFKVADTLHLQPKYKGYSDEIEEIKQKWRDITESTGYPNIDFPPVLPDWFPTVYFASTVEKDKTLEELTQDDVSEKRGESS